jgi:HlyD family secretion protein
MTATALRLVDNGSHPYGGSPRDRSSDLIGLRWRLAIGMVIAAAVVAAIFGWAGISDLSSAVVASGTVVVEGNSRKVQHPQGGVVGELLVKNGSRVAAGDLLIKLDDTQTRASLGIVLSQLIELEGRKGRLLAERNGDTAVSFSSAFVEMAPEAKRVAEGEQRLFEARLVASRGQKAQLAERIQQYEEEISGLIAQKSAKGRELTLIKDELARVTEMSNRNLVPLTRVLSMQRDHARLDGELGVILAQAARLGGQISETRLQIISIDQNRLSDAQKELRETEARIGELQERRTAAEDQLRRINLRAPIDGVVHDLSVHTVGGVIGPGELAMLIVPSNEQLSVEIRVAPGQIDQVQIGQSAILRFTAFNQRSTPEVDGTVSRISPDLSRETVGGQPYYTVRITPEADYAKKIEGKLVPGMPVEAFVESAPRSVLSYFSRPLTDQLRHALREK